MRTIQNHWSISSHHDDWQQHSDCMPQKHWNTYAITRLHHLMCVHTTQNVRTIIITWRECHHIDFLLWLNWVGNGNKMMSSWWNFKWKIVFFALRVYIYSFCNKNKTNLIIFFKKMHLFITDCIYLDMSCTQNYFSFEISSRWHHFVSFPYSVQP